MSDSQVRKAGNAGNEKGDAYIRKVVFYSVVSTVVMVAIAIFGVYYLTPDYKGPVQDLSAERQPITLEELRAREAEVLNSYKILDSVSGVYGIPIRRAMELVSDEAHSGRSTTVGRQ